jgi:hypothetical protein
MRTTTRATDDLVQYEGGRLSHTQFSGSTWSTPKRNIVTEILRIGPRKHSHDERANLRIKRVSKKNHTMITSILQGHVDGNLSHSFGWPADSKNMKGNTTDKQNPHTENNRLLLKKKIAFAKSHRDDAEPRASPGRRTRRAEMGAPGKKGTSRKPCPSTSARS